MGEKHLKSSFFAMLFRMKHIRRWGIMHSVVPENLSSHSMEVAVTAHALCLVGISYMGKDYDGERIALKALYHDLPEIFTGDLPTPVKYFSDEMKAAYNSVEGAALNKLLGSLPCELKKDYNDLFIYTDDEKKIIKTADKLCAYIKCLEEERNGNREFSAAKESILGLIKDADCEEADYFLENFIPSFGETIDTLLN